MQNFGVNVLFLAIAAAFVLLLWSAVRPEPVVTWSCSDPGVVLQNATGCSHDVFPTACREAVRSLFCSATCVANCN